MTQTNEIESKIKNIKTSIKDKQNVYADKVFNILKPYIVEFRKLEFNYGLFPEYYKHHPDHLTPPETKLTLEEAINSLCKHPFICWINKQEGFIAAKNRISEDKLVVMCQPDNEIIREYRNSIALEFVCALIIHYFAGEKSKLAQAVVTKPKIKPISVALKKLKFELKKGGGLYFRHESKQHFLQYLLDELAKDDNKNVYSEARDHENVSRHIITKKIMQALFKIYGHENISRSAAVDIALNLTSIFYAQPMDRREALKDANRVLENLVDDEQFRQQQVGAILAQIGLREMTF